MVAAGSLVKYLTEDDALNLAQLYMGRVGMPRNQSNMSAVVNSLMSGEVPDAIRPDFEIAVESRLGPVDRGGVKGSGAAPDKVTSPIPKARPDTTNIDGPATPMTPSMQDAESAPISPADDDSPMMVPPAIPGYRVSRNAPRADAATSASSSALEGEILGPETQERTAIPDQSSRAVSRRRSRTGRGPDISVTPNPPRTDNALPYNITPQAPQQAPALESMPIDAMTPISQPRVEMVPSADGGGDVPAVQLEMPGKGTVFITADGYIVDANGVELRGLVPPEVEAQMMNDPTTAHVYKAFRRAVSGAF